MHQAGLPMQRREGYVTEIDYISTVLLELNPAWLAVAAGWCGVRPPPLDRAFRYLELGCGHGANLLLAAALFPHGRFVGNDFMASHVESACRLRDAAGLGNLAILPDSFAELARRDDLPEFDFIAAHGVYSWISAENQGHIVEIVRRHLKPGGIFYVSYNCAAGWAGRSGLRQLLAELVRQDHGPLPERMDRALAAAAGLAAAGRAAPALSGLEETVRSLLPQSRAYLVHEYLNDNWRPLHHPEVASTMAAAGLAYIGSARPADNMLLGAVSPTLLPHLAAQPKGPVREQMIDMAAGRGFRCDLYGRDTPPLDDAARRRRWETTRFVRLRDTAQCPPQAALATGPLPLDPARHAAVLGALDSGPAGFAALRELPVLRAAGERAVQDLLTLMAVAGQIMPLPGDVQPSAAGAAALNRALVEQARIGRAAGFLAAPGIAGSVSIGIVDMLLAGAALEGAAALAERAWRDVAALGRPIPWDREVIAADAAGRATLDRLEGRFREQVLPWLQAFGIVGWEGPPAAP